MQMNTPVNQAGSVVGKFALIVFGVFLSIFLVQGIGRDCDWSNEYQSYYDAQTGCYFVYNDDVDTPETQYWYEGFSDRYGDYGWMAYDESSQTWYVEVDYGEWEAVFDPPSYFWHTDVLEPN